MPERTFGRTVRYRRTKLGFSQAQLGELVGRSTATIKSWERDKTRPTDPQVLTTLAAILGVSERQLFDKAEVDPPRDVETSPTVQEALATLTGEQSLVPGSMEESPATDQGSDAEEDPAPQQPVRPLVGVGAQPSYTAPPDPYVQTPLTPSADVSYMEDRSQRQMYRVRTLATLVALVALVVAFIWAFGEGLGALGEWWDGFFSNLRL